MSVKSCDRSSDQRGASMVEYAIMVALIAIIAILAVRTLGRSVSNQFSTTASQLN
ncbi:MAG: Flp family type IVb pilin [Pseudomonadota bacterium]